ncbi:MAG: Cytochrome c-L [Gammaproteobacteria bacterium]|nr:Cytochrome c-L [Gammaproteobacteria bacterium]
MLRTWWKNPTNTCTAAVIVLGVSMAVGASTHAGENSTPLTFTNTFSGEPLDVTPPDGEIATEATTHFLRTAENIYVGDAAAIGKGSELFLKQCAVCHGINATGRMGPSLVDDEYVYSRNASDKGIFETIYGGAGGLMAPLKGRITQDEILKIMAYLRSLRAK